jgi:hypothetical protein
MKEWYDKVNFSYYLKESKKGIKRNIEQTLHRDKCIISNLNLNEKS